MTQEAQPMADLSNEALEAMLRRAMRNTLILGIIPALAVGIASGWRNAAMLLTGTLISAASILEWQRLARMINARLDHQKTPVGAPVVVLFFMLRLAIFAAAIYGSLKFLHGSAVALLCGLGLAVFTMGWEALRMLRE
jgi:uncharacterized membrane protein